MCNIIYVCPLVCLDIKFGIFFTLLVSSQFDLSSKLLKQGILYSKLLVYLKSPISNLPFMLIRYQTFHPHPRHLSLFLVSLYSYDNIGKVSSLCLSLCLSGFLCFSVFLCVSPYVDILVCMCLCMCTPACIFLNILTVYDLYFYLCA